MTELSLAPFFIGDCSRVDRHLRVRSSRSSFRKRARVDHENAVDNLAR